MQNAFIIMSLSSIRMPDATCQDCHITVDPGKGVRDFVFVSVRSNGLYTHM